MNGDGRPARGAFTLLELLAVILIGGLLAAAVVLRLGPQLAQARLAGVLQQLEDADRLARASAAESGEPCEMVFDLTEGRVWRREQGRVGKLASLRLPRGFAIAQMRTARSSHHGGEVAVQIRPDGRSDSYALCVGRAGEEGRRERQSSWLVFAGLSGQVKRLSDERDVRDIFGLLEKPPTAAAAGVPISRAPGDRDDDATGDDAR
ncbi:pilus assembly FimT family protein [Fontivita pretiosa]|uniref:pilus assembly FimT family protein n=1 Tax=Fontivita pretiosa TaxID=2989684 RepID=UPI003D16DA81